MGNKVRSSSLPHDGKVLKGSGIGVCYFNALFLKDFLQGYGERGMEGRWSNWEPVC